MESGIQFLRNGTYNILHRIHIGKHMNKEQLRYELTEDDLIVFLHIPKNSGTTLNWIIQQQFQGKNEILNTYSVARDYGIYYTLQREGILKMPPETKYMRAHLSYCPEFFSKNPVYITFLRDPLKRAVSLYKHLTRVADPSKHLDAKLALELDIADYFEQEKGAWNLQTCMVAGYEHEEFDPYREYTGDRHYDDPMFLDVALENLEKIRFIGITEKFNQSIDLMLHIFGWNMDSKIENQNVAPSSQELDISDSDKERIMKCFELDVKLYQKGLEIFSECYESISKLQ